MRTVRAFTERSDVLSLEMKNRPRNRLTMTAKQQHEDDDFHGDALTPTRGGMTVRGSVPGVSTPRIVPTVAAMAMADAGAVVSLGAGRCIVGARSRPTGDPRRAHPAGAPPAGGRAVAYPLALVFLRVVAQGPIRARGARCSSTTRECGGTRGLTRVEKVAPRGARAQWCS